MKTRKAIAKRFKLTKNKKVRHRTCGQDHFNARARGIKTINKRKDKTLAKSHQKIVRKALGK